jgi:hypothetical protein
MAPQGSPKANGAVVTAVVAASLATLVQLAIVGVFFWYQHAYTSTTPGWIDAGLKVFWWLVGLSVLDLGSGVVAFIAGIIALTRNPPAHRGWALASLVVGLLGVFFAGSEVVALAVLGGLTMAIGSGRVA